ncbi:M15 family metallopeptidase [Leptolyngbya sp. BC1307]|uniref:M15 family metallopeptidase n=1 Tax=Leptolyngbya sp. BC1307 TaxID=2029589 RepID=UPI000EFAA35E|nr:M15 family metallopeptidase [Leptolyngbya sp. BC1307]
MSTPPSNLPSDDIPAARRQSPQSASAPTAARRRGRWVAVASSLVGAIALVGLGLWQRDRLSAQVNVIQAVILPLKSSANAAGDRSLPAANLPEPSTDSADPSPPEQLLNHRHYDTALPQDLVPLNSKSQIRLRPAAQAKVVAMIAKAKSEGVQLGIISGFRSLEDQQYLFFDVKAERGETSKTRAEVSAPPGYSEHHTGYAVDFIDESNPATHLEESFETTAAYQWLEQNAAFYNFEMSFPKDSASPLSYEPWHWRYVGDQESLELFYKE